ncbi:actin binding protein [Dimargaris xerosporica]|nr:actin binding protein [Dimargaris xerosporica]
MASIKVNFATHSKDLVATHQRILQGDESLGWVVYGYDKGTNDLKVLEEGAGDLDELADEFDDGKIQYAFVRVQDSNTGLPKFAFISWCGSGVPVTKKGLFGSHLNDVANYFKGYHVQIDARDADDVDPDRIRRKISESSGARYSVHKEAPRFQAPARPTSGSYQANQAKQERDRELDQLRNRLAAPGAQSNWEQKSREAQAEADRNRRAQEEQAQKQREREQQERAAEAERQRVLQQEREEQEAREQEQQRQEQEAQERRAQEAAAEADRRRREQEEKDREQRRLEQQRREEAEAQERERQQQEEQERRRQQEEAAEKEEERKRQEQEEQERERVQREERERQALVKREEQQQQEQAAIPPPPPAPPLPGATSETPASDGLSAVALYDYDAEDETELTLREDDIVVRIEKASEEWWLGHSQDGARSGLFPANYVQLIDSTPASASAEAPMDARTPLGQTAVAVYDFNPTEENELGFKEGDLIQNIEFVADDWWQGANAAGQIGLFPGKA